MHHITDDITFYKSLIILYVSPPCGYPKTSKARSPWPSNKRKKSRRNDIGPQRFTFHQS